MAVVWRQDRIDVREVVSVRNTGAQPYQGVPEHPGMAAYSLHLPLPEGYDDFQLVQGLTKESVHSALPGLYYTAPLAPGTHRIVYSYALPMPDTVRTMLTRRTLPTRVFDIFVDTCSWLHRVMCHFTGALILSRIPSFIFVARM